MVTQAQRNCLSTLGRAIGQLGYGRALLKRDYSFGNWFSGPASPLTVDLAAFGQTPASYATACLGAVTANGRRGVDRIKDCRSLGAPLVFEVLDAEIVPWRVGAHVTSANRLTPFRHSQIHRAFSVHGKDWSPSSILRAKNIQPVGARQLDFVDMGLLPALEEHIRLKLDPLLNEALRKATEAYKESTGHAVQEKQLFQVAFWLLAGKVFHDRRHQKFIAYNQNSDVDKVLACVGQHYGEAIPSRLLNKEARHVLHQSIWESIDFTNLSVEVLADIWANTLVTAELRKTLGIHSTPRCVAKFVVDHIPFETIPEDERYVVEPCCGSARFLIAAMQKLRMMMPPGMDARRRHRYFTQRLIGFERDPFGVEISRLGLMLADYPNPNGWQLHQADVFTSPQFSQSLTKARVVLCNPPFEDLKAGEAESYGVSTPRLPAALLSRILANLHPMGVLGFVLPRKFLDGDSYRTIRSDLMSRYSRLDLVSLPDRAFDHAEVDTVLLLALDPKRANRATRVNYGKVSTVAWERFKATHIVDRTDSATLRPCEAEKTLAIPDLQELWEATETLARLGDLVTIHRGIEWNRFISADKRKGRSVLDAKRNYDLFVRDSAPAGFLLGVAPQSKISPFVEPALRYLSLRKEHARGNAFTRRWKHPKVILNKSRRSRGMWRVTAFADKRGIACYQTFIAIWPKASSGIDVDLLAAILNSPVANAYIAAHEHGRDVRKVTLSAVPVPRFTRKLRTEVATLLSDLRKAIKGKDNDAVVDVTLAVDAAVTRAYCLSPDQERMLLRYFNDSVRTLPLGILNQGYFPGSLEAGATFHELFCISREWDSVNRERCGLIEKKLTNRLTTHDKQRLLILQRLADMRLQAYAPLPKRDVEILLEAIDG